jgi:hypothetical protein
VTSGGPSLLRPRWITALPGRHRRAPGRYAGRGAADGPEELRAARLVLLILTGDARAGDLAGWRRGRSVLLGVDKKIAMTAASCGVRALPGGIATAASELRQAGRLSRRDLKRPTRRVDFARALGAVRTVMARDVAALEHCGLRVARPAAVFYAVDPPLADAVTAEEYFQLARQTSILWVVPEASVALMSEWFADDDARILTDHDAVTGEVVHLLHCGRAEAQH